MQFLALIYANENQNADATEAEQKANMQRWFKYGEWLNQQGVTWAGEALLPTATATTVRSRNGEVQVTDGPFAETKEQLGGYYLFECDDLDQALALAKACPGIDGGCVEVRPVMNLSAARSDAASPSAS